MSSDEHGNPAEGEADVWRHLDENFADPVERLNAWVDRMTTHRAFARASAPEPASSRLPVAGENHEGRLAELCRSTGIDQADTLADTLTLLVEGIRGDGHSDAACRKLNRICKATIAAFSGQ
jgi:hypothetical protein